MTKVEKVKASVTHCEHTDTDFLADSDHARRGDACPGPHYPLYYERAYRERPGMFIVTVPDLSDTSAPGVRSYGTDPAYIASLIRNWSGFETRWVEQSLGPFAQEMNGRRNK